MITKRFIENIHFIFDVINYHETEHLDIDKFHKKALNTLIHVDDLFYAQYIVKSYNYCLKKWDKIQKIFDNKLDIFNEYTYSKKNSIIKTISNKDAYGMYYFTNGFDENLKNISIASLSIDEKLIYTNFKNKIYSIFENSNYFLLTSTFGNLKLYDKYNNLLCSFTSNYKLKNNSTPYDFILYENVIIVFDNKYLSNLGFDEIDLDEAVAIIKPFSINNSYVEILQLNIFVDDDFELLLYFALAAYLVNKNNNRSIQAAKMSVSTGITHF